MSEGTTYEIRRLYFNRPGEYDVIATGLTLEQAQAHCNDPATRADDGPDGPWFDCYTDTGKLLGLRITANYVVPVTVEILDGRITSVVVQDERLDGPLFDQPGLSPEQCDDARDLLNDTAWPAWQIGW